jgi:hypothetical protein
LDSDRAGHDDVAAPGAHCCADYSPDSGGVGTSIGNAGTGAVADAGFVFLAGAITVYLNAQLQLGALALIIQVVIFNIFYSVVYSPDQFGWQASSLYPGCALAFGLIALFDNWLWPDPAERILPEALAASVGRNRARFVEAANYYLDEDPAKRPPEPPFTSGMTDQLALLERARSEGVSAHRRAVLLAAISREERLHIQIDQLAIAARAPVPRENRMMFRPEIEEAIRAIAAALDELKREVVVSPRTGADNPPSLEGSRARAALDARITELRPTYINRISAAEISNFGEFTEVLHLIVRVIERPLDEPPAKAAVSAAAPVAPAQAWTLDWTAARYADYA